MMDIRMVKIDVKGIKVADSEKNFKSDPTPCTLATQGTITFMINKNTSGDSLSLNIDDKVTYFLHADVVGKILELINQPE